MDQRAKRPLLPAAAAAIVAGCSPGIDADWQAADVCFVEDRPGATSRYVTFAPVRCSDSAVAVGDPVGADYGGLRYEDLDDDGTAEAVIESSSWRCRFGAAPCYDAYRIVLKLSAGPGAPRVRELERTWLGELTPPGTPRP